MQRSAKNFIQQLNTNLAAKLNRTSGTLAGLVIVAGSVGIVGSYMLVSSRAATSTVSFEAENTVVTAPASTVADATASNANALVFSAAAAATDFCSSYPALPSTKPTTANAGIPAGTTLTAYSGPTTITTAGTVIDGKIITSDLVINANNVTVKNSRITSGGYYTVRSNASSGVKLVNNEISSTSDGNRYVGVLGKYDLICGNYIHGFENPISMYEGGATIQANVIDKLDAPSSSAHFDGIEVYGGSNYRLWGNNISMTDVNGVWLSDTGAINISDDASIIDDIEVNGNWLGGGSYTLYVDDKFAYSISNAKLTNNTFYGVAPAGHAAFGPMLIRTPSTVTVNSGNKWENGQPL